MLPLLIAGAAMMAGSAIGNAVSQAKARKKRDLYLAKKEKEIKDDYNNALGDATQSAAAQRATTQADRAYQQGVNAVNNDVTGGALDRAKMLDSVNEARAEAASQITAQGETLRQQAQATKTARMDSLDATRQGYEQQDAQNAAAGWQTLGQVGSSFIGAGMSGALNGSGSGGKSVGNAGGGNAGGASNGLNTQLMASNVWNGNTGAGSLANTNGLYFQNKFGGLQPNYAKSLWGYRF